MTDNPQGEKREGDRADAPADERADAFAPAGRNDPQADADAAGEKAPSRKGTIIGVVIACLVVVCIIGLGVAFASGAFSGGAQSGAGAAVVQKDDGGKKADGPASEGAEKPASENAAADGESADGEDAPASPQDLDQAGAGAGEPAPAPEPEPDPAPEAPATLSVSVYVDASAAADLGYPSCMANTQVTLSQGATVFDALVATGVGISGSSTYVTAINGLAEKDLSPTSGWVFVVNGQTIMRPSGSYVLSDGDAVTWMYVS